MDVTLTGESAQSAFAELQSQTQSGQSVNVDQAGNIANNADQKYNSPNGDGSKGGNKKAQQSNDIYVRNKDGSVAREKDGTLKIRPEVLALVKKQIDKIYFISNLLGLFTWEPTSSSDETSMSSEQEANQSSSNKTSTTISVQKQARHLAGTAKSGGGYMNTIEEAQSVLDAVQSGKATYLGTTKAGFPVYRVDGITGTNVNYGVGITAQPTNVFIIKGTVSPSVVPTSPTWNSN